MPQSRADAVLFQSRKGFLQNLRDALSQAAARRRDRRLLAHLDVHLLRDIGLTPEDARSEAAKPFWRP
jgi:uncharacterized protein YjiS (DUF1127 family)